MHDSGTMINTVSLTAQRFIELAAMPAERDWLNNFANVRSAPTGTAQAAQAYPIDDTCFRALSAIACRHNPKTPSTKKQQGQPKCRPRRGSRDQ